MKKKLLSAVLSVCMIFTLFVNVNADTNSDIA